MSKFEDHELIILGNHRDELSLLMVCTRCRRHRYVEIKDRDSFISLQHLLPREAVMARVNMIYQAGGWSSWLLKTCVYLATNAAWHAHANWLTQVPLPDSGEYRGLDAHMLRQPWKSGFYQKISWYRSALASCRNGDFIPAGTCSVGWW